MTNCVNGDDCVDCKESSCPLGIKKVQSLKDKVRNKAEKNKRLSAQLGKTDYALKCVKKRLDIVYKDEQRSAEPQSVSGAQPFL